MPASHLKSIRIKVQRHRDGLREQGLRPIQIWVRTAGLIDLSKKTVTAFLPAHEAALVKTGQRVQRAPACTACAYRWSGTL